MGDLSYQDSGHGDAVLLIAGHGAVGRTWHIHQVPAFLAAGYRVVTFDNRGVGAKAHCEGFTTATMVDDTATLIEELGLAPVRLVGVSMGSFIAQELMLARPELVSQAVLMATRGRHDRTREFFHAAEEEFADADIRLPPTYDAKIRLLEGFSPMTLNDEHAVEDWIDTFTMWPSTSTAGTRAQFGISPENDRLPAYRSIATPVLVIGFADDVVMPPYLGAEVAEALPNGRYVEIADAGHLGFLERPDAVNAEIIRFLTGGDAN